MPAQDTIDSNKLRFIYFVNKTFMLIDVHKVNYIMKLKDIIWLGSSWRSAQTAKGLWEGGCPQRGGVHVCRGALYIHIANRL